MGKIARDDDVYRLLEDFRLRLEALERATVDIAPEQLSGNFTIVRPTASDAFSTVENTVTDTTTVITRAGAYVVLVIADIDDTGGAGSTLFDVMLRVNTTTRTPTARHATSAASRATVAQVHLENLIVGDSVMLRRIKNNVNRTGNLMMASTALVLWQVGP